MIARGVELATQCVTNRVPRHAASEPGVEPWRESISTSLRGVREELYRGDVLCEVRVAVPSDDRYIHLYG